MSHGFFPPSPPLAALVDYFWATTGYAATTPRERVLPNGNLSIVFHLGAEPVRVSNASSEALSTIDSAVLCGARTSPLLLDTTALGATVGVAFKAGGVRPFLGVRADEVSEQALALDLLWGSSVRTLRAQLIEEPTPLGRVQLLQHYLLQRARRPLACTPALLESLAAFDEPHLTSVAAVNRRTGLSAKRLLALYRDEVGLSPKTFWRVRRFRAALHALDTGALRGAPLAAEHGYCDQPHFLREFRAFTGGSPSEYLAARVPGTDHVLVRG